MTNFGLVWFLMFLTFKINVIINVNGSSDLDDKLRLLTKLSSEKTIVKLDVDNFRLLVLTSPRNYSMIVMFTALSSRRECAVCRHAGDEFQLVANSYRGSRFYSIDVHQLFFSSFDFDDGSEVFKTLKISSAPVFKHFPAKGKPKKMDTMEIQRFGYAAEALSRWINDRTNIPIRVVRPPNYFGLFILLSCVLSVTILAYFKRSNLDFIYNKTMWAVAALCFCFAMTSGQMWNHIRGPPFIHRAANTGQFSYIHGGSQAQFVVETYIIFTLNAVAAFGMIVICEMATSKSTDVEKLRLVVIVCLVLFVAAFTVILSFYRLKAHG